MPPRRVLNHPAPSRYASDDADSRNHELMSQTRVGESSQNSESQTCPACNQDFPGTKELCSHLRSSSRCSESQAVRLGIGKSLKYCVTCEQYFSSSQALGGHRGTAGNCRRLRLPELPPQARNGPLVPHELGPQSRSFSPLSDASFSSGLFSLGELATGAASHGPLCVTDNYPPREHYDASIDIPPQGDTFQDSQPAVTAAQHLSRARHCPRE